jgi:paraquat-inducible protein A
VALHLEEWAMLDVYILGIGVTLIKVHGLAEVQFNLALFCLLAVGICSLMITAFFDREQFWAGLTGKPLANPDIMSHLAPSETAREAGLLVCHHCHCLQVSAMIGKDERQLCQRCNAPVHERNNKAVANTWALLIAAVILFIPANLLPIMRVYFMGVPDESTILDGIIYFFQHGSIGIGLIILTASIIVPLFKMVGLFILLVNIQFNQKMGLAARTKMFHFIEFIGRWSMLDIFVIGLMAILISFGKFTAIVVAPAATYFCLVVVTTMLAASAFDSRLLWDESNSLCRKQP